MQRIVLLLYIYMVWAHTIVYIDIHDYTLYVINLFVYGMLFSVDPIYHVPATRNQKHLVELQYNADTSSNHVLNIKLYHKSIFKKSNKYITII